VGYSGIDGAIHSSITDGGAVMDPVMMLLLFNVAVWCYWTFK
jgi:hypothetical protein